MPDTRFSSLQVDIVGPLPPSRGHKYLLTIIDRTSRWVEALPLTEATAEQCCNAFIHGWAQRFGLPTQLRSDNGNTFVATLWRNVHKAMGIEVACTPPYHPASLGHIERQHKDIKVGLKAALYAMGRTGCCSVQKPPISNVILCTKLPFLLTLVNLFPYTIYYCTV